MLRIVSHSTAQALLAFLAISAQGALPQPRVDRIKADLDYLASPDLMGRETGTVGAAKAAAYLAEHMQATGLTPIRAGGMGGITPFHYPWTCTGGYGLFRPGLPAGPGFGGNASDVVGVLPGRDPGLSGEYVFITAHFDHLGDDEGTLLSRGR